MKVGGGKNGLMSRVYQELFLSAQIRLSFPPFLPGLATDQPEVDKLFWSDGEAAGKAYSRAQEKDAYWQRGKAQRCPSVLWHVLGGEAKYL